MRIFSFFLFFLTSIHHTYSAGHDESYDHTSIYRMICSIQEDVNDISESRLSEENHIVQQEVYIQIRQLLSELPLLLSAASTNLSAIPLEIFGVEFGPSEKFNFFKLFFSYVSTSEIKYGIDLLEENNLINAQDKELFLNILNMYKDFIKIKYPRFEYAYNFQITSEYLSAFSKRLSDIPLASGDVIISVGNTPAWLLKSLELSYKQQGKSFPYPVCYVGISSHPNSPKHTHYWCKDIVTDSGLENYRQYLRNCGFLQQHEGNIYFIDIIGSAGGIAFLIEEYINYFHAQSKNAKQEQRILPTMNIIALNQSRTPQKLHHLQGFIHSYLSLNLNFASILDQCPDNVRFMPKMPAYLWNSPDTFLFDNNFPVTEKGKEIWETMTRERSFENTELYY